MKRINSRPAFALTSLVLTSLVLTSLVLTSLVLTTLLLAAAKTCKAQDTAAITHAATSTHTITHAANAARANVVRPPNVLWITVEDMSPILGCYGDQQAVTPHIDRLAGESVRFTHAFASAPVCSPARNCLITGCYPPSLGTHNMRSAFPLPPEITGFPSLLRKAGYFTTNQEKTDYNTSDAERLIQQSWDRCSNSAHWRDRPEADTPFFSVINLMTTHQSRTMVWPTEKFVAEIQSQLSPDQIHDPAGISLPPYYPDTPVARREWARLYDCVTVMDQQVGDILEQLQQDGLSDDTIVFFFSDHGSGMPRHKRCLLDSGMHVPLLIRFPARYAHLAPGPPGSTCDALISFVDFAPTVLSLATVSVPDWMQGQAFLGDENPSARRAVCGHRDRVDEAFDTARSVRTEQFLYIRNFMPHLSYNQPTAWPDQGALRHEFYQLAATEQLTDAQRHFAGPHRAVEELYDCVQDPLNLQNLASSADHQLQLQVMRTVLQDHIVQTADLGFIPESHLDDILQPAASAPQPSFKAAMTARQSLVAQSMHAAMAVGVQDPVRIQILLNSENPVARYWGAVAVRNLTQVSLAMRQQLERMLATDVPVVRLAVADALAGHQASPEAVHELVTLLQSDDLNVVLLAMRTLELLSPETNAARPAVEQLLSRCRAMLPPSTADATFVLTKEQDLAMFISFSASAWLARHSQ